MEHLKQRIFPVPHVSLLYQLRKAEQPVPDTHLIQEMDFHEIASVSQDQVCDFDDGVGPHAVVDEKAEHANFFNHVVSVSILIYVEPAHAKVRQTVPHESLKSSCLSYIFATKKELFY